MRAHKAIVHAHVLLNPIRKRRRASGFPLSHLIFLVFLPYIFSYSYDATSDRSSDLPHNKINNPLFSDSSRSPTSTVAAASAREGRNASTPAGAAILSGDDSAAHSSISWLTDESTSLESAGSGVTDASLAYGGGGRGGSAATRIHQLSSVSSALSSQRLGTTPYGLSPVAETSSGGRGEGDITSSSSAANSHPDSDMLSSMAPNLSCTSSGMGYPLLMVGEGDPGEDDDSQSLFQSSSPGAVSRPLQPLMAQQSPLSCGTQSAVTSRSNSFASPTAANRGRRNLVWAPGAALPGSTAGDTREVRTIPFSTFSMLFAGRVHSSGGTVSFTRVSR